MKTLIAIVSFLAGAVAGFLLCHYKIVTVSEDDCDCDCCFDPDDSDIADLQALDGADEL